MTTFLCLHAGGHRGSSWDAVARFLTAHGHLCIAPDLPSDDPDAGWDNYIAVAERAAKAVHITRPLVIVAHSLGGVIAGELSRRIETSRVVYLCAALGPPGISVRQFARETGILPQLDAGAFDARGLAKRSAEEWLSKGYHDAPKDVATAAISTIRGQALKPLTEPVPALPTVPMKAILTGEDRLFDSVRLRDFYRTTLRIDPLQIPGGHFPMASRPELLALLLEDIA